MTQLTLSNIEKSYNNGITVLKNVSLDIESGEFIVFVGPSGCGKSTLLRMIAGLEHITGGILEIDGQRMNDIPASKRGIAMVFQSYALYPHLTVRDNMSFALKIAKYKQPEIDAAVDKASKALKLDDLLDRLPKELSGGQRQRIAIARVLLKDAPILILDEATSALDSEVEAAIQQSLYRLMENKTVIAIAHRLSTIAAMDRLIVLDDGKIAEQGTHEELLAQGGIYAQLWAHQTGGFLGEG
ncbi:ABC transporter ATP-binding protein [Thalassolituus sp. UBA2107]|uniref:ABC transporter ATP-binding protein n=1 Tax=Thalassolituus sp. UBA2107 TaxID=1947659 RepID=UPI002648DC0D|nr:ABC transporter ATP-binding protein [Thalassolituus sp. UBA2107]